MIARITTTGNPQALTGLNGHTDNLFKPIIHPAGLRLTRLGIIIPVDPKVIGVADADVVENLERHIVGARIAALDGLEINRTIRPGNADKLWDDADRTIAERIPRIPDNV